MKDSKKCVNLQTIEYIIVFKPQVGFYEYLLKTVY